MLPWGGAGANFATFHICVATFSYLFWDNHSVGLLQSFKSLATMSLARVSGELFFFCYSSIIFFCLRRCFPMRLFLLQYHNFFVTIFLARSPAKSPASIPASQSLSS
jgi:hypothetical protein